MIRQTVRQALRSEAGFSLTEVVISSVLLLVMAVSVLPLFTRAAANNEVGRQSTELANMARSRAEELRQLPFNAQALTLTSGTELVADEQYSAVTRKWVSGTTLAVGDRSLWLRRTTIRQYGIEDLDQLDTPLPAATPAEGVHVKEIRIEVRGTAGASLFGPAKGLTIRMLKSL